jgi:hypothetical protein
MTRKQTGGYLKMITGYKYYLNPRSASDIVLTVDSNVKEFCDTMGYNNDDFKTADEFIEKLCRKDWVVLMHEQLLKYVDKKRMTLGLGSGFGEHEFLLHKKGYNVIASDIVPELNIKTNSIFTEFKVITLDILKDNVKTALQEHMRVKNIEKYDLLDTGLLSYYNNQQALLIFKKFYDNLPAGCNLIFISRYRDYIGASILEKLLYFEGRLKSFIKKEGLIIKQHGYRRTDNEIIEMAQKVGFEFVNSSPVLSGYEVLRSSVLSKLKIYNALKIISSVRPFLNTASIFKFIKK